MNFILLELWKKDWLQDSSPHFSSGIVDRVIRGRYREKWETTDKAQAFDLSWLTDFGVWSLYSLSNKLSASNGIPSVIQLLLLLSSVNCRGYLLQVKENPDTDFLHGCFARRTEEKWGLLTVSKKDNAKMIVRLLAHCWLECCIGINNFFRLSFHNYVLSCVFHCNDLCNIIKYYC